MALATTNPTLADVAKRTDPNGKIDTIVEMLNETNEILQDMTAIEGNLPTGHKTTVRTGIPEPTWRKLYGGVQPTKSQTRQITDNCGMLEAYAEVDKALADLNGNTGEFRLSEDRPHIEGMNQEVASTLFYGNEGTEPAEFTGLVPRYNSLSGAESSDNVINGTGAAGNLNTSIWLVNWGPNTVHTIYPKGTKAGLEVSDKGQVTIEDVDGQGGRMEAYRSHYKWNIGLTVRDWRYAARVCNLKVSDLVGNNQNAEDLQKNLVRFMIEASERIPTVGAGRPGWYVNRTVMTALRLGILAKISNNLSWETVEGKRVMVFDDIPIRRTDAILNTEAQVA